MKKFKGKVAVVTGAASGIGRALALDLAKRGARLALSDVNETGLDETARQARALGAEAHAAPLNVADEAAVQAYANAIRSQFGVVHQLYNNAGVTTGAREFLDMRSAHFEQTMNVNFWGVVYCTRALLPDLIASGDGALVNISSLNGLMAQAGLTAYCSSKFAVRGFTEAVRSEMLLEKLPVQVVSVHPGGVKTGIAANGVPPEGEISAEDREAALKRAEFYNNKLLKMPAERAAAIILNGVERGRSRIVITSLAVAVDKLVRMMPEKYVPIVTNDMRRRMAKAGLERRR